MKGGNYTVLKCVYAYYFKFNYSPKTLFQARSASKIESLSVELANDTVCEHHR
jgi:hypothetical protein